MIGARGRACRHSITVAPDTPLLWVLRETLGPYAAHVVEVSADESGGIRVHRVVCAVDCELVVNRSGAEAQVEGGIMDALGAALYGEITINAGQVEQRNFDRYRLLRMKEAPVVEVHFVTGTPRPTGLGEPRRAAGPSGRRQRLVRPDQAAGAAAAAARSS
jgi:CO/xanthine dehydrogenase Mo-binding subunit